MKTNRSIRVGIPPDAIREFSVVTLIGSHTHGENHVQVENRRDHPVENMECNKHYM